ncbi:MAG: polyprenol monophosphomannose synthase [Crocinitomicaceae bacterium]
MPKTLILIPTYNEIENISLMVQKVMGYSQAYHVLIIDDNSPDGTGDAVREFQKDYPDRLHLIEREGKLGLGTAYIAGFKWSLEHNYDYSIEMDCDFSHNPDDLERLVATAETGYDLVIGSRYCKGGEVVNWPLGRKLMSYYASVYVRMVLWINVKDTTAGFKCYRNSALVKLNLTKIPFKGYAFQIFMKYQLIKKGFKYKEIPISFKDRERGNSKMSSGIFKEAIIGVLKMRFLKL